MIDRVLQSLFSWDIAKVTIKILLITFLVFLSLTIGVTYIAAHFGVADIWVLGGILTLLSGAGAAIFSLFLFPAFVPVIASFFYEEIAEKIEAVHYPALAEYRENIFTVIFYDTKLILKVFILNILFMPIYLIPGVNMLAYYILNSYLIGTSLVEIIASRYYSKKEGYEYIKQNQMKCVLTGLAVMIPSTIPFLNLVAPVIGIVIAIHLVAGEIYHKGMLSKQVN